MLRSAWELLGVASTHAASAADQAPSDSGWVLWAVLGLAYLLPTLFAAWDRHPHWPAIGVLNLLLGWTALGWVAALVWAFIPMRSSRAPAGPFLPPKREEETDAEYGARLTRLQADLKP